MRSIHLFGMGFTQTLATNSGQISLWLKARRYSSDATSMLTPMSWRTDPREVANFLALLATDNTKICGYFYSWGAGWFFRRLVREMRLLNLSFDTIVLCDPVVRIGPLPSWLPFNPLSLTSLPILTIPENVRNVHVFYQKMNKPAAHGVKLENPSVTKMVQNVRLNARHEDMEDQDEYHYTVLEVIREISNA